MLLLVFVCLLVAGIPTTTARSSKRGMANKLVDLARQVGGCVVVRMCAVDVNSRRAELAQQGGGGGERTRSGV